MPEEGIALKISWRISRKGWTSRECVINIA